MLLRNEGALLPLSKTAYKSVAVIGPTGDDAMDTVGSWAFQQQDSETVTLAAGLRKVLGDGAQVTAAPGVQIRRYFPSMFDQILHQPPAPTWSADEAKQQFDRAVELARHADLGGIGHGRALEYVRRAGVTILAHAAR